MPGALALWDLVRACRNPDFVIRNNDSKTYLLDKNLVEKFGKKGRAVIPQVVRSTVTSIVVGEGLNLRFRIPAAR